jgi:hypothetical protein
VPAEPESVHDNQDEAAVRAHVQGSMEVQRLVTHLKQIEARAKAGAASSGTRLSTGKAFQTHSRRFRAFLGAGLYGQGPARFNRE